MFGSLGSVSTKRPFNLEMHQNTRRLDPSFIQTGSEETNAREQGRWIWAQRWRERKKRYGKVGREEKMGVEERGWMDKWRDARRQIAGAWKWNLTSLEVKGKGCHTPLESIGGVLISLHRPSVARLLLKSVTHGQREARPTVTFPAAERHRPLTVTELCCFVTYPESLRSRPGVEPSWWQVLRPTHCAQWRTQDFILGV